LWGGIKDAIVVYGASEAYSAAKRLEKKGFLGVSWSMVLKKKRGLSKLEFYHNARKMRKELTMLVLRDFGIHSRGAKFKADTGSQQP
jgi:hypothetical protein